MIVSASRRTDLPAFHADWLCRRFSEGYALVRNPFRFHQVQRVPLTPETVDGLVFWTKDPLPLAGRLGLFRPYPFYIQWTLTPYGRDIEPGLPAKPRLIAAFRELGGRLGPLRLVWRYDPVLLSPVWTLEKHKEAFARMAAALAGASDTCVVSFLDSYRHRAGVFRSLGLRSPDADERAQLIDLFQQSTRRCGFALRACCEEDTGLPPAACIDTARLEAIGGGALRHQKDRSQRPGCTCAASVDIGAYDTCPMGCRYCYAVRPGRRILREEAASPLLGPPLTEADVITDRAMPSLRRDDGPSLFPSL